MLIEITRVNKETSSELFMETREFKYEPTRMQETSQARLRRNGINVIKINLDLAQYEKSTLIVALSSVRKEDDTYYTLTALDETLASFRSNKEDIYTLISSSEIPEELLDEFVVEKRLVVKVDENDKTNLAIYLLYNEHGYLIFSKNTVEDYMGNRYRVITNSWYYEPEFFQDEEKTIDLSDRDVINSIINLFRNIKRNKLLHKEKSCPF